MADFDGSSGMTFKEAQRALSRLGISSTYYGTQSTDYSDLPDLAIISVYGESALHAVVFRRKDGEETIWDYGVAKPTSAFKLVEGDEYLEIHQ